MREDLKFANVAKWIQSNVLAGFEIQKVSNKYSALTSQINADESAVAIKVSADNFEYVASYDSYVVAEDVTDSNGEQKMFGKKWHKAFTMLDNVWFGDSYIMVIQKKFVSEEVWNEALATAKSQEAYATEEVIETKTIKEEIKMAKNEFSNWNEERYNELVEEGYDVVSGEIYNTSVDFATVRQFNSQYKGTTKLNGWVTYLETETLENEKGHKVTFIRKYDREVVEVEVGKYYYRYIEEFNFETFEEAEAAFNENDEEMYYDSESFWQESRESIKNLIVDEALRFAETCDYEVLRDFEYALFISEYGERF